MLRKGQELWGTRGCSCVNASHAEFITRLYVRVRKKRCCRRPGRDVDQNSQQPEFRSQAGSAGRWLWKAQKPRTVLDPRLSEG